MTGKHLALLTTTAAVAIAAAVAFAAIPADAPGTSEQEPVTLTGCLRVGSAPTVFLLRGATAPQEVPDTGQAPRDYLLVSVPADIDLGAAVNQRVAITGPVSAAGDGPPPPDGANTAERALRRLAVTSLRVVSERCD